MTAVRRIPLIGASLLLCVFSGPPSRADGPTDLSGTWSWTWTDAAGRLHRHVLEVEGIGSVLAARERFDDQDPVKVSDVKREGKNVRLTAVRGDRRAEYRGVLADASTINGTVSVKEGEQTTDYPWKATRGEAPKG
ncbi:MAG: hypothetical protein P4L84_17020 [Isosphaeraceae bacterium]|nr:hypothetical protein [Isosphaeraceae bacterium]